MGELKGERAVDIDAPIERCFEIAADIEHAPAWQGSLRVVRVLTRDGEGRAERADTVNDAKVKTIRSTLRFSYDAPHTVSWVQEKGDTKAIRGGWRLSELDGGGTRATYWLAVDPGRVLGLLLRGPAESRVRDVLLGDAAAGLKRRAEGAG